MDTPAEQKRTTAAWRKAVQSILCREVHPDYELNRAAKGRFVEFTRRDDESGVVASYSFVRIRDCYYSCFVVTLGLWSYPVLTTPFMAGSRFDNNRTIYQLFDQDFGVWRGDEGYPPSGVWSSGEWKSNTLDLLAERLAAPESHLLPRYLAAFRSAKQRLAEFVELGAELCDAFDGPPLRFGSDHRAILLQRAPDFGCDPAVIECMQRVRHADALRISGVLPCFLYGSREAVDSARLDLRSVAFSQLVHFFEHQDDLPRFASTLHRL